MLGPLRSREAEEEEEEEGGLMKGRGAEMLFTADMLLRKLLD